MLRILLSLSFLFVLSFDLKAQTIWYVKAQPSGAGNGSGWENASNDLQKMIDNASEGDEVRVAAGVYLPNKVPALGPFSRDNAFRIQKNIRVLGGFPKNGGSPEQRDWNAHRSILSGDLHRDDTLSAENYNNNCYHVVISGGAGVNAGCVIDGFTIIGGAANVEGQAGYSEGGGVYNETGDPLFRNLLILGNRALYGGGFYNAGGNPSLENIVMRSNRANMGGGIWIREGNVTIADADIVDNHSTVNGGGVYLSYGNMTIRNVSLKGNTADRGGAIYLFDGNLLMYIAEITGNVAERGAVYSVTGMVRGVNCTVAGNACEMGLLWSSIGASYFYNSIVWGNTSRDIFNYNNYYKPVITHSLIELTTLDDENGNINGSFDPAFVGLKKAVYSQDLNSRKPTISGDFSLLPCSPVINRGENSHVVPEWNTDLDGNPRVVNGVVDLGAHEHQGAADTRTALYVDVTAAPGGDGTSWGTALKSLAEAVRMANNCPLVETIHVAKGTYYPEYKTSDRADDRDKAFYFHQARVAVLGGYPSGGGARNWRENRTILSGDIDRNGVLDNGNSLHVIVVKNSQTWRRSNFDGLIVTGGNANENTLNYVPEGDFYVENENGGGLYYQEGSPIVQQMIFEDNYAGNKGGGCYFKGGYGEVRNTVFQKNSAYRYGGGCYVTGYIQAYHVTASGNWAGISGGGWYTRDTLQVLVNTIFWGNSSGLDTPDYLGSNAYTRYLGTIIGQERRDSTVTRIIENNDLLDLGTLYPRVGSPLIDAGVEYREAGLLLTDLAGNSRVVGAARDIGAYEYQSSLPVQLVRFEARPAEQQIELAWSTAMEENASRFEIQYSADAQTWKVLGTVNAGETVNTSTGLRTYRYFDRRSADEAPTKSGLRYYRLRMIDHDATFAFSEIRSVRMEKGLPGVRIYPNPTIERTVYVELDGGGEAVYKLSDLLGNEVATGRTSGGRARLDLNPESQGIFLLQIIQNNAVTVKKIVLK